jgi:signal transduction histidine kinase
MNKSVKSGNPRQSVIQTSYDIIKAHGGTISVESGENSARPPAHPDHSGGDDPVGRGTEFIIHLPTS